MLSERCGPHFCWLRLGAVTQRDRRRLHALIIILALLLVALCLSIPQGVYRDLAESHRKEALSYRAIAASPIEEQHGVGFALGSDKICRRFEWHRTLAEFTPAEIAKEKHDRELAGRRATYHDALGRKYWRAAWFPWLPIEPDPPEPQEL